MQEVPAFEADRYRRAIYNRTTKQTKILTEALDYDIDNIQWGDDSQTIYFTIGYEGYTPIYKIDIKTPKTSEVTGKLAVFDFEVTQKNNSIYYMARKVEKHGEIYKFDLASKESSQLTFFNKHLLS